MDQKKIGNFLKTLRRERGLTQEQLAEQLNVSGRTVSRWETGRNMPDISLLVLIAELFGVSIPEIIDGERKCSQVNEETKEVAKTMSNYAGAEKALLLKRMVVINVIGLVALLAGLIMESVSPDSKVYIYEAVKGMCFGFSVGTMAVMILYTTGALAKLKEKRGKQMKRAAAFLAVILAFTLIAALVIPHFSH